jgi:ATP-dependent Clp protease adaptor protein ClpS
LDLSNKLDFFLIDQIIYDELFVERNNTVSGKTSIQSDLSVIESIRLDPPKMWHVILHNDSVTTMEFVVLVLMQIFHKSFVDASDIMMNIHDNGKGIAGTYSNEVAVQKRDETIIFARSHEYPLKVEIEPND